MGRNPNIEHHEWIANDPNIDDALRGLKIGDRIEVNYRNRGVWCPARYEGRDPLRCKNCLEVVTTEDISCPYCNFSTFFNASNGVWKECRPGYGSVRYDDTPDRICGCR